MTPDTLHLSSDPTVEVGSTGGSKEGSGNEGRESTRPAGFLSISELISATGVTRATVHHYSAVGVLPLPAKTAHNMAYYNPECVEIIKVVRAMRDLHLPLATAREVLAEHGVAGARAMLARTGEARLQLSALVSNPGRGKNREALLDSSGIAPEDLDAIEALGMAHRDGDGNYDALTVELVEVLVRMADAGMTEETGFRTSDIALYMEEMSRVVAREVGYFGERLLGRVPSEDVSAMIRAALESAETICVLVRRRLLLNELEKVGGGAAS